MQTCMYINFAILAKKPQKYQTLVPAKISYLKVFVTLKANEISFKACKYSKVARLLDWTSTSISES